MIHLGEICSLIISTHLMTLLSHAVNSPIFFQVKNNRRNASNVSIMQSSGKKVSKHQRNQNACFHLWQFCHLQQIWAFKSLSVNNIMTCWLRNRDIKVQQICLVMICMEDLMLPLIPKVWLIRWWDKWNTGCTSSLYKSRLPVCNTASVSSPSQ